MTAKRVTGIGGIFFKANDPKALKAWYRDHLAIQPSDESGTMFEWLEADGSHGPGG